jgi:hypothetical protein
MGHIEPWRAQLTTLSSVDRTYSSYMTFQVSLLDSSTVVTLTSLVLGLLEA